MAYFEELNIILNNVISEKILRNQKICKTLFYYPDVDSFTFDPLSKPDITQPNKLLMEYIFPLPKLPDANTKQHGYLTVTLTGGDTYDNDGYRNVELVFDIIVHLSAWSIKQGLRPYIIAEEIDKMFNNQQTNLPINNKPTCAGFKEKDYSNYYYGIQVAYQLSVNSNVGANTVYARESDGVSLQPVPSFLPKNLGLR